MNNREILFRGKNGDVWVDGYYVNYKNDSLNVDIHSIIHSNGLKFQVDPETIGQYTGLKDKNDVKIFEGDCVKGVSNNIFSKGQINTYNIMYAQSSCKFHVEGTTFENIAEFVYYCNGNIEVIGNIHDK